MSLASQLGQLTAAASLGKQAGDPENDEVNWTNPETGELYDRQDWGSKVV